MKLYQVDYRADCGWAACRVTTVIQMESRFKNWRKAVRARGYSTAGSKEGPASVKRIPDRFKVLLGNEGLTKNTESIILDAMDSRSLRDRVLDLMAPSRSG